MHFSLFVNLISERKKRNCDVENFNIVQRSLKQNGFIKKGLLTTGNGVLVNLSSIFVLSNLRKIDFLQIMNR